MRKEMTRILALSILFALLILPLVFSATTPTDVRTGVETGKNYIKAVVEPLVGPLFGDQEFLTKILMGILLYMVIFWVVSAIFKGKRWMNILATLIIVALSVIFLPAGFITALRSGMGAMGMAILSVIPFAIMLGFTIRLGSRLTAQILWLFFCLYYFALLCYEIAVKDTAVMSAQTIPYVAALVAGLIIFFFIGTIQKALFKGEMNDIKDEGIKVTERSKLLRNLTNKELEGYKRENWDK